jgi:hypothetical protein
MDTVKEERRNQGTSSDFKHQHGKVPAYLLPTTCSWTILDSAVKLASDSPALLWRVWRCARVAVRACGGARVLPLGWGQVVDMDKQHHHDVDNKQHHHNHAARHQIQHRGLSTEDTNKVCALT